MVHPESGSLRDFQPMLDGFEPQPEVQIPTPVAPGTPGDAHPDYDRPYDELGGGAKEHNMVDPPRFAKLPRQPRPSGHVRDVEPRYNELDPEWTTRVEVTPEQRAINAEAFAKLREWMAPAVRERLVEEYGESQARAIERARAERRNRII